MLKVQMQWVPNLALWLQQTNKLYLLTYLRTYLLTAPDCCGFRLKWLGSLVVSALDSRLDSRRDYSTGMGDCLLAGKPPQYFTKPPRPTQPPTPSGRENK